METQFVFVCVYTLITMDASIDLICTHTNQNLK